MYYSVIGMIAIVLHLIMNHKFVKVEKNRDEINRAYRKLNYPFGVYFASLNSIISDVFYLLEANTSA